MTSELEILQRRFDRERQARKLAEAALEQESLKLYHANEQLKTANQRLEGEVVEQVTARQESEAHAASIVDTALDAVIAIDATGKILAWNRQAHAIFGWTAEEAAGRLLADLIVPTGPVAGATESLATVLAAGFGGATQRRTESVAIDRTGRLFPVELAISSLTSHTGGVLSIFIRDIGERRQSEQRRAAMYQVARVLAEASTVEAARGQILQIIGETMGWKLGMAWDVDEANGVLRQVAAWSAAPGSEFPIASSPHRTFERGIGLPGRIWSGGAPVWIADLTSDTNFPRLRDAVSGGLQSALGFPIMIGAQVIGVMEFFCDSARRPDNDLLAVLSALGTQIGQFIQRRRAESEAEAARKHAEQASAAKSEFLAKMSHEIRTPLNGVVGMVELLSDTTLDEQQRRFIQIAKSSADSLLSIINDILDFSKIEAGRMDLDSVAFEPRRLMEEVVDSFSSAAARKGLELGSLADAALPRLVVGDPGRFRQVLTNLIGNAIKFTQVGRIIVRMTPERTAPAEAGKVALRVEVDDTGIGIPPDKLDRLFKSFSQADASTTRTYGGTGLGLAISQRLVQLMGGAVGVNANPTGGSTFWFTVVLGASPETALSGPATARRIDSLRVLVVDDNPASLEVISAMIAPWTSHAQTTTTAAAALELLHHAASAGRPFDVAMLDIRMPGMDGWALASVIRSDPALRETRLLAIAGIEERIDRHRLAANGFDRGVTKPMNQSRLFDALLSSSGEFGPAAPQGSGGKSNENERAPQGARVLVAEDNEINQFVIRKMLTTRGYECDIVNNGRQAVELSARSRYHLVLMDCSMPEMDGFEATRLIRRREAETPDAPRLPIVALTAEAMNGDRERCRGVGMDDYVVKPIDPGILFGTMRRLIDARNADTQNPGTTHPGAKNPDAATRITPDTTSAGTTDTALKAAEAPLIDFPALLDRSLGDIDFAKETLERFKVRVEEDLTVLYRSLAAGSFPEVARLAHGLKGVAGHVGAQVLRDRAAAIEALGHAADRELIDQSLAQLREDIRRTTACIPMVLAKAMQPAA